MLLVTVFTCTLSLPESCLAESDTKVIHISVTMTGQDYEDMTSPKTANLEQMY